MIMSGGALESVLIRLLPKLIKPATSILKNFVATLGLSAAMSGIDGAIQKKKIHGTGTTVIFSNEEVNDIAKIVKALEDSDVLMKGSTETLKNDIKKGGALKILPMLLETLGSSLIGNLLTGRGMYRAVTGNKCNCHQGKGMYRADEGKGLYRIGQGIKKKITNSAETTPFNKH